MHTKTLNFKVYSFLPFLMYVQSIEVQANQWHGLHKQMRSVSGSFLSYLMRAQACQLLCWTISRNCEKNQYGTKSQKKKTDDFYKNIEKYPLWCMSYKKTNRKRHRTSDLLVNHVAIHPINVLRLWDLHFMMGFT